VHISCLYLYFDVLIGSLYVNTSVLLICQSALVFALDALDGPSIQPGHPWLGPCCNFYSV